MVELLNKQYFHNQLIDYLIAVLIIFLGTILIGVLKNKLLGRLKNWVAGTANTLDDFAVDVFRRLGIPALYLMVIFLGFGYLNFPVKIEKVIANVATVAITVLVIRLVSSVVMLLLKGYLVRQEHGQDKVKQLSGLMIVINVIIWTVGILFLFDNMGYNVTALVTGLGIGGIAVALAAQHILGDLFNYFVIFLDKPFEVGDFVTVDDKSGTIEYIGVKTTRILSLTGEQLVFANSDLTGSRIHNYKLMETRRAVFALQVAYEVSPEKLALIPGVLKDIVVAQLMVKFDRAHWVGFGESSLNFEVVYFVLSSDYNTYMDIQQSINLKIFQAFSKMGIPFARPTASIYLQERTVDQH